MQEILLDYSSIDRTILSPAKDTKYIIRYDGSCTRDQKSLVVRLETPNVACRLICGFKLSHGQVVDLVTTIIHRAPGTQSDTIIRGVLLDGGVANYVGKVVVEKTAVGSISKLDDKTLVVGDGIRNHAEPTMQIETNDVAASHASTTGRVDEGQVYYLQSRGLSREESVDLLIDAFLNRI